MKLCDICGSVHESYQAHVFAEKVANESPTWLTPVANAKKSSYRYRDPEKRREYMRELMRKRRSGGH